MTARESARDTFRDDLIRVHADAARRIAARMARRCPTWIHRDDLISAGMIGLIEAAERYDRNRAEPFLAFAEHRIRGAILDELRRGDILPRRKRQLARKAQLVRQTLEQAGTTPTDEHIAHGLGISLVQYRTEVAPLTELEVTALTANVAITHRTPYVVATHRQALDRLALELAQLDEREASIIDMHYVQELSYSQIAATLSISPARVCQLITRAMERLRETLSCQLHPAAA